jgi:hypothetical protein
VASAQFQSAHTQSASRSTSDLYTADCAASACSDVCVSCTTDDGDYAMFDTRGDMQKAVISAEIGKMVHSRSDRNTSTT